MEQVSNQRQSLLCWASKLTDIQIQSPKQLLDGKILRQIMEKSNDFSTIARNQLEGWKGYYFELQAIFKQIQRFYKQSLKQFLPSNVSSFNLVDMAKGQDQDGLVTLLKLLFLACIRTEAKQNFITVIFQLQEGQQNNLMKLITQSQYAVNDISIETEEQKEKQRINQLFFNYQSLQSEHESLQAMFQQEVQQTKKIKAVNRMLEEENKKLRKELSDNMMMIRNKEEETHHTTTQIINQSNNEIIEQLKKSLYQQEEQFTAKKRKMQEKIDILEDQLTQQRLRSPNFEDAREMQYNPVDHTNCISIKKYNEEVAKYTAQIKQKVKAQYKINVQLIQCKSKIQELKAAKSKLQANQNQQKTYIDKQQAQDYKFQMLTMLRDRFKKTLQETKKNNIGVIKPQSKINNASEKENQQKTDQLNLLLESDIQLNEDQASKNQKF